MTSFETLETLAVFVFDVDRGDNDDDDDDSASVGTIEDVNKELSIFDSENGDLSSITEYVVRSFTDDPPAPVATTEICTEENVSSGSRKPKDIASRNTLSSTTKEQESSTSSYLCNPKPSMFSFHCKVESNSIVQHPGASPESRSRENSQLPRSSLHTDHDNVSASVSNTEESTDVFGKEFALEAEDFMISNVDDDDSFDCDFDDTCVDLTMCLFWEESVAGDGKNEQDIVSIGTMSLASTQSFPEEAVDTASLVSAPYFPPQVDTFFDARRHSLLSSLNENNAPTRTSLTPPHGDDEVLCVPQPRTEASGDRPQCGRSFSCAISDWPQKTHFTNPTTEFLEMKNLFNTELGVADWINTKYLDKESTLEESSYLEEITKDESAVPWKCTKNDKQCAQEGEHSSFEKEKVIIYELTENDYIIGRGGHISRQPCNQRIRDMIQRLAPSYSYHGSRARKLMLVDQVIEDIYAKGGRLLERDPETHGWIECSRVECRAKVSQRFREEVARARRSDR